MKKVFENRLNILLSELLNEKGVISSSEQIGRGRKDIIAYCNGLRIFLEGSYNKNDAEKDAIRRINQLAADLVIAIHYLEAYPQTITEAELKNKLKASNFEIKVLVPEDFSGTLFKFLQNKFVIKEEWFKVDLDLLANLIKESTQFIISEQHIEEINEEINYFIENFVHRLSTHPQSLIIAKNLYDVLFKLYGFSIGDPEKIREAIFAQSGLALLISSIYYETIRYAHRKKSLKALIKAESISAALTKATEEILEINYEPIFETSKKILECLPSTNEIFGNIIDLASKIAAKRTLLRRDLVGKIYHRVVGDWSLRKGLATFFTQIPAAYLLLHLAEPKLSKICDFACGSGTLLTAAYSAARTQEINSLMKRNIEIDTRTIDKEFHKKFIKSCYAFDVLKYATQITALNLSFHSPETPLKKDDFHTYTLSLGLRKENHEAISLGSLDFINLARSFDYILGKKVVKTSPVKEETMLLKLFEFSERETFPKQKLFDLITMNPPFTRAGGRWSKIKGGGLFGFVMEESIREPILKCYNQLRKDVRQELIKNAEKFLANSSLGLLNYLLSDPDYDAYKNIGQAGEGLLFLYLAHLWIKEGGKICFVLPKNFLSGISWFLARCLIASRYHLEHVIVSYDSEKGYNFSESTNLSECLFSAKKTQNHSNDEITKFVILLRKPATSIEAIILAKKIKSETGYVEAGDSQAFIVNIKRETLLKYLDNWGRFIFLPNLTLLDQIGGVLNGIIKFPSQKKTIPLTRLNNLISSIGIDPKQFSVEFKIVSKKVPGAVEILYGGGEEVRSTLKTSPNGYALPIRENAKNLFIQKAGRLLLPSALRIDTAHIISMVTDTPILGHVFYAAKLKEENNRKLKALCLWLNSTWGLLTILANREETAGGWIQLKMAQWKLLPVIDISKLSNDTLKKLETIFDRLQNAAFRRITEQYNPRNIDRWRYEIDSSFLKALGLIVDRDNLISLYKEIYSSFKQWLG
jgi:hypothetical protein